MSSGQPNKTDDVEGIPTNHLARLNPFKPDDQGGEEQGQEVEPDSVAGGGKGAGTYHVENRLKLRVSHAMRNFLHHQQEIKQHEIGEKDEVNHSEGVNQVLLRPQISVPPADQVRTHPLAHYWISSSHNTYLTAKQLYGGASTMTYQHTLSSGARCVEIDVWDNDEDESSPKVTHGFTLTAHIPFRDVCETISKVIDQELQDYQTAVQNNHPNSGPPAPVMLSLENHCSAKGQERVVTILKETLGDKLVTKHVADEHASGDEKVRLDQLYGKLVVMVEYYGADFQFDAEKVDSSDEDEESKAFQAKKAAARAKIIPELLDLGLYAHSIKPTNNSWLKGELKEPLNPLVNLSESALKELASKSSAEKEIIQFNSNNLMRVYPKGTRINSYNLNPVRFWNLGAHVCALNWQTFDASMQLNEALFAGSDGYVLKPKYLTEPGTAAEPKGKLKIKLEIAGGTDLPCPQGREDDIKPYISCSLHAPSLREPLKRKTHHYHQHKHTATIFHKGEAPPPIDPIFKKDEPLEWEIPNTDLAFLRMLVKSDDSFAKNPLFAVATVRINYVPQGWHFVRLLDLKGRETSGNLLIKFTVKRD